MASTGWMKRQIVLGCRVGAHLGCIERVCEREGDRTLTTQHRLVVGSRTYFAHRDKVDVHSVFTQD